MRNIKFLIHNFKKYLAVFFIIGFCSIITQSLLIREFFVIFYGNELCIGIILFGWFIWIALGARLAATLIRRYSQDLLFFRISLLTGILSVFPQLYFIRIVRSVLNTPAGEYIPLLSMFIIVATILSPFCFY